MGLTTGRQVFTGTTAYNLAGELKNRQSFRKTAVVSAVLGGEDSVGRAIIRSYLKGPGTRLRQFHRWAETHYKEIGSPYQVLLDIKTALASDVREQVRGSLTPVSDIAIQGIEINVASYQYWADQYMLDNHQELFTTNWRADISETTGEITIWDELDNVLAVFAPYNFDKNALYLYATYRITNPLPGLAGTEEVLGIFIYRIGSGDPVLDPLVEQQLEPSKSYFPVIPIRIDNEFLSESYMPKAYGLAKRAFKKATGSNFSEMVGALEKNTEALPDIDYAYMIFGASATSQDPQQLAYIYTYLDELGAETGYDSTDYDAWENNVTTENDYVQFFSDFQEYTDLDGAGTPPAEPPGYNPGGEQGNSGPDGPKAKPFRGVLLRTPGPIKINYDVRITWTAIKKETNLAGLGKPDAQVGEHWFAVESEGTEYKILAVSPGKDFSSARKVNEVYLYKQVSQTAHERLKIIGMVQQTYVFGNHYEELDLADEVLGMTATEESSFIFPLRYSTLAGMSLIDSTEFALSCQYLTLHAYEIKLQRFYESQAFIIFIVVAITIATAGTGLGAQVGILGSNAAVGIALGFTAATAAIVGFVVNALAAMVLSQIILAGARELFGARLGTLIGTVMAFLAINGLTNMAAGNGFTVNFGNLSSAENLMKLTSTTAGAYQNYMAAGIRQTVEATQKMLEEYEDEFNRIEELYAQNIGYGNGGINPLQQFVLETPEVFIERTLMTGSDIADLSLDMVSNFAELTINTRLPLE